MTDKPSTEERKPWERMEKESSPAWEAFAEYRNTGPSRSLQKVSTQLSKSMPLMKRWSARWSWVNRCREWDAMLDRRATEAHANEVSEMRKRHARLGMAMQTVGGGALKTFQVKDKATGQITYANISPHEAARLLKEGVTIERVSRGEPDTIAETRETDVDSAFEREVQRLLDDPNTRRELDRAGSRNRVTEVDSGLNGGGGEQEPVEED